MPERQVRESENPADWIMDIIAGEVPNHRIRQFVPEMPLEIKIIIKALRLSRLYQLWELNAHVVHKMPVAPA